MHGNNVAFGDFNLDPTNPVMLDFLRSQNSINLIKRNICLSGKGSRIDLILTKKIIPSNIPSYKAGLSDHHHLIYSLMKTSFSSEEPKTNLIYRDYSKFSPVFLKHD